MTSIKLYSKQNCTQCDQAKVLLQMKNVDFKKLQLDQDFSLEDIKTLAPTARTFPVIFKDSELLGGLKDLKEYLNGL